MAALPSSGAISMSDMQTSFSGAPANLGSFYKNGSYVEDNAINTAIPTSGEISFSDMYGAVDTTSRNLYIRNEYYGGGTYYRHGVFTLTTSAGSATSDNSQRIYSPVFRAGTGFVTSLSIQISWNEDLGSFGNIFSLYGGTSETSLPDTVFQWNGLANGSSGGLRQYTIGFNADGSIPSGSTGLNNTYNLYAYTNVSLVTDSRNSNHRWYRFSAWGPTGSPGKTNTGTYMIGTTTQTQPIV